MLTDEELTTLDFYNNTAGQWASTLSESFWQAQYDSLQKHLPKGKILDLGCGYGRDSYHLSEIGYQVVGVDISTEMVKLASVRVPKARFFVQSFYELDFPPQFFDAFWAANTLHHIPRKNLPDVLEKVKKVTKDGAVGFISVKEGVGEQMKEWRNSGKERYFIYYHQDEFAKILTDNDFKILEAAKLPPQNERQDGTFLLYFVQKTN